MGTTSAPFAPHLEQRFEVRPQSRVTDQLTTRAEASGSSSRHAPQSQIAHAVRFVALEGPLFGRAIQRLGVDLSPQNPAKSGIHDAGMAASRRTRGA